MQQDSLFSTDSPQQDQAAGPVICLGKTLKGFPSVVMKTF